MNGAKTLAIILHFGSIEDTLECLDSIQRSVTSLIDIFVVNNGPDKEVESILRASHPKLLYRHAGLEVGFSAGNNIGLRFSLEHGYHYSLLLNNDIVAEKDFLKPLTDLLEMDPMIAMAGPAIYWYDNREQLWSCGGWINRWSGRLAGETCLDRFNGEPRDVDYLPGACILARNSALERIGCLSEEYFLGVEEADWAIRARRAGFTVVAHPKSVLLHKVGLSSRYTPELIYNGIRNRFLFLRRQFPIPLSSILTLCVFVNELRKDARHGWVYWRALRDHYRYGSIRRSHLESVRMESRNYVN
jgi:GT2 family glycosyltransferase